MNIPINWYAHSPFLADELKQLLPDGSFAARLWRSIGNELHEILVDDPYSRHDDGYSVSFPVDALFGWGMKDGGLDPEWFFCDKEGAYIDDNGDVIPSTVKPAYSAVEQLAAYGLWLLDDALFSLGPIPDNDADIGPLPEYNRQGWKREDVIEHRAACTLLAYQALAYAQRILRGTKLTAEEAKKASYYDFSAIGKAGAIKRHAPMAELREWATRKYRAKKWNSANEAAHALTDEVLAYGRTIGAELKASNAQRTVYDWFLKSA